MEDELESEVDEDGGGTYSTRDELVTSIERVPRSTSTSSSTPYTGKKAVIRRSRLRKGKNEEPAYYRHGHKYNIFPVPTIFVPYLLNSLTYDKLVIGTYTCLPALRLISRSKGPYLNDVYTIFGILDPLPPRLHSGQIHSTKITQPPLLHQYLGTPSPLPV